MLPSGLTAMRSAAGSFGRPGIVMMSPHCATTNPAPAAGYTSFTVMRNPVGRPSLVASSLNEYCVFAMQIGVVPRPIDWRYSMFRSAFGA